jgi:hypothetical protein
MYTIIAVNEIKNIREVVNNDNQTPTTEKQELGTFLNTILGHNYMKFNDQFYNQNDGLAMGGPTSAVLVETFIQYLERTKIIKLLDKYRILDYYRYVDSILIVYNKNIADIENTLIEFNTGHPKINFTIEKETRNTLNYLDVTITNNHNKLTFRIYRKPTNTDLILHNDSCHPNEHKNSAITYLVNHITTYPIT